MLVRHRSHDGLGAVALAAALLALFVPTAPAGSQPKGHAGHHDAQTSDASAHMHDAMMKSMDDMKGMMMTGDADHDFAMMMRQPHGDGVAMAEAYLKGAKDTEMRAKAEKIIAEQKKAIADFDRWLSAHKMSAAAGS